MGEIHINTSRASLPRTSTPYLSHRQGKQGAHCIMALSFYSRFRLELPLVELLFSMHALLWDTYKCPCHHMQTWYSASYHPHIVSISSQYFTPKSYTNAHGQSNKAILIFLRLLQTTEKLGCWRGSGSQHLLIKSSNSSG
jgi:hypothetical protein